MPTEFADAGMERTSEARQIVPIHQAGFAGLAAQGDRIRGRLEFVRAVEWSVRYETTSRPRRLSAAGSSQTLLSARPLKEPMSKRKKKPEGSSGDPTRKRLPGNAPCPCDSGKKYKHCCYDKGFEYLVDEEGNIFKSVPMTNEVREVIEEQKRKFIEKFGREPEGDENLFFDMPPLEHAEHFMVEGMKQAGLDPAIIYAFEKTGLLVTEMNEHLISNKDREEWEAAVREYRIKKWEESDDGENELF